MSVLNQTQPFSFAFGGGGGSYGGLGGVGYGDLPQGKVYNNDKLEDLLGGSGGCMRDVNFYQINALRGRDKEIKGRGGGGGE